MLKYSENSAMRTWLSDTRISNVRNNICVFIGRVASRRVVIQRQDAAGAGARRVWRLGEQTRALAAFAIRLRTTKYSAPDQVFCVTGFLG